MEKSLKNYNLYLGELAGDYWNGSKFSDSYGPIDDFTFVDYWTLRKRSLRLFRENPYAKGIVRRLLWNVIHTGIIPQPTPMGAVIWPQRKSDDQQERAVEHGETISQEFELYASNASVFSYDGKRNFWQFQATVYFEKMVCGDGIIVRRLNKRTGLPCWQWINGDYVRTPADYNPPAGHFIRHGVEFNSRGEKVAFHVQNEVNGEVSFERVPCKGEKSGETISWMVYGSENLIDDTRGEPFLADTLYMIKDLDRYRDAETRAAVVNAMLAFFIKRAPTATTISSPLAGLSQRLRPMDKIEPENYMPVNPPPQEIRLEEPGTVYDNLMPGDDIISPNPNRPNVNYATFEGAILATLAWTHGIPPEILTLKFGNNYSASRQANNEFEIFLARETKAIADDFCQKIYNSFLSQSALRGQLFLPGFTKAYVEGDWRMYSAWTSAAWIGLSRPSVDRQKEVSASKDAIDNIFSTWGKEARDISGMSFMQILQIQKRERNLMKKMGIVPHVDEDNNGNPAYGLPPGTESDDGDGGGANDRNADGEENGANGGGEE